MLTCYVASFRSGYASQIQSRQPDQVISHFQKKLTTLHKVRTNRTDTSVVKVAHF